MILVGCTNEIIIRRVYEIPDSLDLTGYLINILLRGDACCLCLFLNLLTVLVGSGLEIDIVSFRALISCDRICENDLVSISDMRLA